MNEQNIPTAPEQSASAAPETAAPRAPAEEAVTVGALRGAIERKAEQRARRAAEESAARWSRAADELAAPCPDFDLGAALSDAQFCALLRAGVDVRTAWFALHAQALLEATLLSNPAWEGLTAVREGRYHVMDQRLYNVKPNARWGEAYEKLADILYPEQ